MLVYILLFIFILLFFIFNKESIHLDKKAEIVLISLPLVIVAIFRANSVGGDLERYLPVFYSVAKTPFLDIIKEGYGETEYLYIVLIKLISLISASDRCYIMLISLFILIPVFVIIYKRSVCIVWSVLIFLLLGVYTGSFNIIRASISISIGLVAHHYLLNNKYLSYWILVVVAFFFHRTAFALILLFVIRKLEFTYMRTLILLVGSTIFSVMCSATGIFSLINLYVTAYGSYLESDYLMFNRTSVFTAYSLFLLIISFFALYIRKISKLNNPDYDFYVNCLVVAYSIQIMASSFTLLNRIAVLFSVYLIFLLPLMFKYGRTRYMVAIKVICFLILSAMYFKTLEVDPVVGFDTHAVVPYIFLGK